jgi:hypothetical protein
MPYASRTNGNSHPESTYGFRAPPGQGERLAGRFEPKFIAPAPYFSQEDCVGTEVFLMVELPSSEDLDVYPGTDGARPDATLKRDERG